MQGQIAAEGRHPELVVTELGVQIDSTTGTQKREFPPVLDQGLEGHDLSGQVALELEAELGQVVDVHLGRIGTGRHQKTPVRSLLQVR